MLKSNTSKDDEIPVLKIPIDVLLDNMTRDEHINLLSKLFDRLGSSNEGPEDLECPGYLEDFSKLDRGLENGEPENDYLDEVRTCAGCDIQSERDLCSNCEPLRDIITRKLNSEIDFYHKEFKCTI